MVCPLGSQKVLATHEQTHKRVAHTKPVSDTHGQNQRNPTYIQIPCLSPYDRFNKVKIDLFLNKRRKKKLLSLSLPIYRISLESE